MLRQARPTTFGRLAPRADWHDAAAGEPGGRPARRIGMAAGKSMSRACFALVAIVALMMPVEAGERASHLLDQASLATAYAHESDTVTAYTTAMARFRFQLAGRSGDADLAVPLEPRLLRTEFSQRTWRSADSSLLQGFAGKGGFR
ncbi:hypothetical protein EN779_19190, partial [Mesorhizobium sp. M4B.F.Ca.ET.088.02.2.1]